MNANTPPIIEISGLNFSYSKKHPILKNLNLTVPKGAIYGFLGPNGAGKSTTMQILTDIINTYEGSVNIFNKPLKEQTPAIFKKVGALVESPSLYLHLTGYENLEYITPLKQLDVSEIDPVLKTVGLADKGKLKVKKYSLGMKQRLAIGMALLGNPELLFLDEPVNGLDPVGMTEVRQLLVKLNKERGTTIFISSHLLAEIEKMCTHIAIIHHGEVKFEGTMSALKNLNQGHLMVIETDNAVEVLEKISLDYSGSSIKSDRELRVSITDKNKIPEFVKYATQKDIPIYAIHSEDDLEDWFLKLTK
jgi:ABC-2 type transport system ATP-binding protein